MTCSDTLRKLVPQFYLWSPSLYQCCQPLTIYYAKRYHGWTLLVCVIWEWGKLAVWTEKYLWPVTSCNAYYSMLKRPILHVSRAIIRNNWPSAEMFHYISIGLNVFDTYKMRLLKQVLRSQSLKLYFNYKKYVSELLRIYPKYFLMIHSLLTICCRRHYSVKDDYKSISNDICAFWIFPYEYEKYEYHKKMNRWNSCVNKRLCGTMEPSNRYRYNTEDKLQFVSSISYCKLCACELAAWK